MHTVVDMGRSRNLLPSSLLVALLASGCTGSIHTDTPPADAAGEKSATAPAAPAAPTPPAAPAAPAAPSPADPSAERIGARAKDLEFEIPLYKYESIFRGLQDMLEPKDQPAAADQGS